MTAAEAVTLTCTCPREGSPPGGFDLAHVGPEAGEQLAGVVPHLGGAIEETHAFES